MDTDHAWDALVEVTNANVGIERGALNKALALIKSQVEEYDVSGEELAIMIRHQATLYREVMPTMPLTANALAKWWGKLETEANRLREIEARKASEIEEKRKTRGVNLQPRNGCVTCGSDMWVVVRHRQPQQTIWAQEQGIKHEQHPNDRGYEETAPCPACNADSKTMANFWDGRTWSYGKDPGEVVISG